MSPSPFDTLPPEIIERILLFCDVYDVAIIAQTGRRARSIIYQSEDQYFWRELFLSKPFDDLRKALPPLTAQKPSVQPDWKTELQRRVSAESAVMGAATGPRLERALATLVSVVETALPFSDGPEMEESENLRWLEGLLRFSTIDEESLPKHEQQHLGRLMTYLALTYESSPDGDSPKKLLHEKLLNEKRRMSRCYVYDLRRYKEDTLWGPFSRGEKGELRANWVHVQHIVNVVAMKLRELPPLALQLYSKPRAGLSATQAYSAPFAHDRKPHDWAGVAGTWRRFVCFMDYRDLFAFNFSVSGTGPRDRDFFDDDYQEAIRPVELHLDVLDPTPEQSTESAESPPPHPVRYPPIFFKGLSRGAHSADAAVEGSVRVLADGSIRWSFVTKYDGLTQWSAEGLQIGNICSAAGVGGIWTGAFHEDADPAGPFWMWKVHRPFWQ
ncbi:uncharacterized protein C8Q71DRAFT_47007 [Rhodofomes roseus]|uniref:F-box domain-containing protein n=1 Tax=Rhodofomes roseus TaxID=34475 RepID=A0ABQ8KGS4_9APHY|nr:uncharacterized protein C8Q71DRAFT_47007 [Rhodofomes roseus]KAH9836538.1 hypothetical protein C8Q71DRAFT_47007 [Rhodofomes roseus]